ncbi:MAG: hypothetical protein ACQESR_01210 [Planctomycetota bacterium]
MIMSLLFGSRSRVPLHRLDTGARMDATGLSRGGSRSPLQTGQTYYSWPSVAWNVTDHGTSPWHSHLEKPFLNMCVRTSADIGLLPGTVTLFVTLGLPSQCMSETRLFKLIDPDFGVNRAGGRRRGASAEPLD